MPVTWDQDNPPGAVWRTRLADMLDSVPAVLVVWTEASIEAQWVWEEADAAKARGCMVPVSLDGVEQPLGFNQIQCTDLSVWDGNV